MRLRAPLMGIIMAAAASSSAPTQASEWINYVAYCTDQELAPIAASMLQPGVAEVHMAPDRAGIKRPTNAASTIPSCTAIAVPYDKVSLPISKLVCSYWNRKGCEAAVSVEAAVASLHKRFTATSPETYRFQTVRSGVPDLNYTVLILRAAEPSGTIAPKL